MYASELIEKFLLIDHSKLPTYSFETKELSASLPRNHWLQVNFPGYFEFTGYQCYEAVDMIWKTTPYFLVYFKQKEPIESTKSTSEINPSEKIDVIQVNLKLPDGTRKTFLYLSNDPLLYGYHRSPIDIKHPDTRLYFGRPIYNQTEDLSEISPKLREYWATSLLVQRALRMLISSSVYGHSGYMSKTNYVNIHHVWWPLVSDLKRNNFTHDDIDRTWVYIEGVLDPVNFSQKINETIDELLSSAAKVADYSAVEANDSNLYSITANGLFNVLSKFIHPMCHYKVILKINTLTNIEEFRQISECRDLSLTKYKKDKSINFRIVLRNIFKQFYTDNSAFDYPTKNPALTSPYDDRDCYSDVSEDYYREPCVHAHCRAKMADGSLKSVQDLVVGDIVATPRGGASIKLIVETLLTEPTRLVKIPGLAKPMKPETNALPLVITEAHPIQNDGQWILPKDHPKAETFITDPSNKDRVYSFVLDKDHIMMVEEVPTICLAHGLQDPVIAHEYLGTDLIIKDLERLAGYSTGKVKLRSGDFLFNKSTGKVTIKPNDSALTLY